MARQAVKDGHFDFETTAKYQLTKAGEVLMGKMVDGKSSGEFGFREYVWAIKIDNFNKYRSLTPEEEKLFDEIITQCFIEEPQKIKKMALLEESLKQQEISVEEYFETKDRLGLNTFADCIFRFKNETGFLIVRCTKHELTENIKIFVE